MVEQVENTSPIPFFSEKVTNEEFAPIRRKVLEWAADHPGISTLLLTATGFLIGFAYYAYLFGRGLAFGVPASEIPTPESIYVIILYGAIAAILLPTNIAVYHSLSSVKGALRTFVALLKSYGICLAIILVLVALSIAIMSVVTSSPPDTSGTSPAGIVGQILSYSLVLSIPVFVISCAIGAIQAITQKWTGRKGRHAKAPAKKSDAHGLQTTEEPQGTPAKSVASHIGARAMALAATLGLSTVLFITLGICYAYGTAGADIAVADSKEYFVVFSNSSNLCVQECVITDNIVHVDTSNYQWIPKTGVVMSHLQNVTIHTDALFSDSDAAESA